MEDDNDDKVVATVVNNEFSNTVAETNSYFLRRSASSISSSKYSATLIQLSLMPLLYLAIIPNLLGLSLRFSGAMSMSG